MFFNMNNFSEIIYKWCDYEKEVKNHNSWKYRYHLVNCFSKRLITTKWQFIIEEIELSDIINYIIYYKTTPIQHYWKRNWRCPSRNAEYNVLCAIRTFFKYCCIIWLKLKFNWEQIPLFKQDDARREPMLEEDYNLIHYAIRKYAKSEEIRIRDELMVEIPRETWLRKTEITRLKFSDFHNTNRQCRVLVKWNRYETVFYSEKITEKSVILWTTIKCQI